MQRATSYKSGALFAGAGVEVTFNFASSGTPPTVGAELRASLLLPRRELLGAELTRGYVYARLAPYLRLDGQSRPRVRLGFGATAPAWSELLLTTGSRFFPGDRLLDQTLRVLTTLLLLPAALVDHAEFICELGGFSIADASLALRLGAAF